MRERKRESYTLHAYEFGAGEFLLGLAVASLFENLVQRAHLFGFFQEQPHSVLEVAQGPFLAAAARGNVQFQGLGHEGTPLFEDACGELDFHNLRASACTGRIASLAEGGEGAGVEEAVTNRPAALHWSRTEPQEEHVKTYNFKVVVEADEDFDGNPSGWHAYCPVLEQQGASTWGATEAEALRNLDSVVHIVVESMLAHGERIPEEPADQAEVTVEPRVAITV